MTTCKGTGRLLLAAVVAATAVTGCTKPPPDFPKSAFRRIESEHPNVLRSEVDFSIGPPNLRAEVAGRKSVTVGDVRAAMADTTKITHDRAHGTQVEYSSKDGKVYLWYPGNSVILPGRWRPEQWFVEYVEGGKLIKRFEYSHICFAYGANTYNPATGQSGGGWECMVFDAFRKHLVEVVPGDVFNLRNRTTAPFILTKEPLSLKDLRARFRSQV
jgi:hypothetical protein